MHAVGIGATANHRLATSRVSYRVQCLQLCSIQLCANQPLVPMSPCRCRARPLRRRPSCRAAAPWSSTTSKRRRLDAVRLSRATSLAGGHDVIRHSHGCNCTQRCDGHLRHCPPVAWQLVKAGSSSTFDLGGKWRGTCATPQARLPGLHAMQQSNVHRPHINCGCKSLSTLINVASLLSTGWANIFLLFDMGFGLHGT